MDFKKDFPLLKNKNISYLDSGATTQKPICVIEKIEDDKLFYIMSRGLSEKDAMKLIVKAKYNKILETIKDEELKKEIVDEIDKRLD